MSEKKLVVGKYYDTQELSCDLPYGEVCFKSDFCDTGNLTKECLECSHLQRGE